MTRVARVLILTGCLLITGIAPAVVGSVVLASPAAGTWDVVVYGATPAGISAAIAAGRQGRRVVLVEPTAHIGGMMTSGLGMSDIGSKDAIGGLAREFFKRLGVAYQVPDGQPSWSMTPGVAERVARVGRPPHPALHLPVMRQQRSRRPGPLAQAHRLWPATLPARRAALGGVGAGRAKPGAGQCAHHKRASGPKGRPQRCGTTFNRPGGRQRRVSNSELCPTRRHLAGALPVRSRASILPGERSVRAGFGAERAAP